MLSSVLSNVNLVSSFLFLCLCVLFRYVSRAEVCVASPSGSAIVDNLERVDFKIRDAKS
jgi:hypothetical protein